MKNWKTSLGGILGASGSILTLVLTTAGVPSSVGIPVAAALVAIGHLLTGVAAQDAPKN